MSGLYGIFTRAISEAMGNFISSLGSAAGPSRSSKPSGAIDGVGREALHANLSPRQAKDWGLLMSGICGHRFSISSKSAALTQFLASRLQTQLPMAGSMLFRQIWKARVTKSGRQYWEH